MDNRHKIAKHNQLYEKGQISYNLKLNKYADLLHHEFVRQLNGFNKTASLKWVGSIIFHVDAYSFQLTYIYI